MLTLSSHFVGAGRTTRRPPAHFDVPGVPVDFRVVLPEPGVPEDELLLAESGHGKLDSFAVALVMQDHIGNIPDGAGFIGRAVYIEDQDGLRELVDQDFV